MATPFLLLLLLQTLHIHAQSSKRGLIYIPPSKDDPNQDAPLIAHGSNLNWYYNYGPKPSTTFLNSTSPTRLEFVPMLWGAKDDNGGEVFAETVGPLLDDPNQGIKSLLFMNEPDMSSDVGGSDVDPDDAAKLWQSQFGPLKEKHPDIQLGSPAVSNGPDGFPWLGEFFDACDGKCQPDFMAIHYYGPFDGLSAYVALVAQTFPNITGKGGIWLTEWAFPGQDKGTTEAFVNQSLGFLDGEQSVKRYSYFGSFKSSNSHVGENVAMLDKDGKLTGVGTTYTGVTQSSVSGAGRIGVQWMGMGVVIAVVTSMLFCEETGDL